MIWVHRYCRLLVCATLLLVAAGGMVTSTGSGLSVPDWPTTYGKPMFSFPLSQMVGGIFYEHGHRLIATAVGLLTIGLVLLLWRFEPRPWVRRLGVVALGAVVLQGVLGGVTVLYFLPAPISIGHAGLAQLFFCLTVALALFTSRGWVTPAAPPVDDARLRRRLMTVTVVVYGQILLGATMRHLGAGLAVPDFPLIFGGLLPPVWTPAIALHVAHRVVAVIATVLILANAAYVWRRYPNHPSFTRTTWLLILAVAVQVALGGMVVLSGKQPAINTLHVAMGGIALVTSLVLTLRAYRVRFRASEA